MPKLSRIAGSAGPTTAMSSAPIRTPTNSKRRLLRRERSLFDVIHLPHAFHRRHARLGARRAPEEIEHGRPTGEDQHRVPRRWLVEPLERHEHPAAPGGRGRRPDTIPAPVPGQLDLLPAPYSLLGLDEHVVVYLEGPGTQLLAITVEHRVERLSLVPGEILLRGPVVRFERGDVGLPLEVMAQLVGQRLPGLLAPVEIAEAGERLERSVIENDTGLQAGAGAAPLERDTLAQRVDVATQRMRDGLGADLDLHDPALELRRTVRLQPPHQCAEVIQSHSSPPPHSGLRIANCGLCDRPPPCQSAIPNPQSAIVSPSDLRAQVIDQSIRRHTLLQQRVAIAHGDGLVLGGLAVDRDAERRAGLVLPAVAAADRPPGGIEG